jgi:HD-GYP domain-containing protein (c-di-GMP phosphodiesterase class II)
MLAAKGDNKPVDTMSVSLNELITALSAAFDLAGGSDRKHSLRTAYIATRLASIMSTEKAEVENIYYAALLHDLIPPQSYFGQNLIFEILANLPLKLQVADQVAELWQYKRGNGSVNRSDCLSLAARTIYLAECFENLYCNEELEEYRLRDMLSGWNIRVVAVVDSEISEALGNCLQEEAFWQDIKENRVHRALEQIAPEWRQQLNIDDIEKVSCSFSLLIDRKNLYTGQHSQRVGMIAGCCAQLSGLGSDIARRVSIAGYLHDLGKLSVPEAILNKPAALTECEMQLVKAHPYDSYAVLSEIKGFADIARWAGNHHERMDGSGYPWGRTDLTLIDQIIAVADIYEALTSNRPYRRALSPGDALNLIKKQVVKGEIMADAYELLEAAIAHGSRFKEWGNQAAYGNKHWFNPVYLRTQAK